MNLFDKVCYGMMLILLFIMILLLLYIIYLNFKSWILETYNIENKNIFNKLLLKIFNID